MKKVGFGLLKFIIPVLIFAYLIWDLWANQQQTLTQLRDQSKNWLLLLVAFLFAISGLLLTIVRWYLLVVTIGIKFRLVDAFRLGFLGYLFNFVGPGGVGGDLFKAIFLAREQPQRKAEAVATVIVDRMIGLYALLIVTSVATLGLDLGDANSTLKTICYLCYSLTVVGGIGLAFVLLPGFTSGSVSEMLSNLPKVGHALGRTISAIRMYRRRPGVLVAIGVMSLMVHTFFATSLYLISVALFDTVPTFAENVVIVPLSMLTAAIPISPGGLGTLEIAFDYLSGSLPAVTPPEGQAKIIALVFRVMTLIMAGIGVIFYYVNRKEVSTVLHDAETMQEDDEEGSPGSPN
ncbi:MAG: lysylphosphatidylglycerol synthase transmembrane domain-containing protein [Pirellulales bacterium]